MKRFYEVLKFRPKTSKRNSAFDSGISDVPCRQAGFVNRLVDGFGHLRRTAELSSDGFESLFSAIQCSAADNGTGCGARKGPRADRKPLFIKLYLVLRGKQVEILLSSTADLETIPRAIPECTVDLSERFRRFLPAKDAPPLRESLAEFVAHCVPHPSIGPRDCCLQADRESCGSRKRTEAEYAKRRCPDRGTACDPRNKTRCAESGRNTGAKQHLLPQRLFLVPRARGFESLFYLSLFAILECRHDRFSFRDARVADDAPVCDKAAIAFCRSSLIIFDIRVETRSEFRRIFLEARCLESTLFRLTL